MPRTKDYLIYEMAQHNYVKTHLLQKPMKTKDSQPIDLSHTLRDLALLRASDFDFSSFISYNAQSANSTSSPIDRSVQESYLFVQEAHGALKLFKQSNLAALGGRVEDVRSRLDELVAELDTRDPSCEFS